jgi:hypothetical protein
VICALSGTVDAKRTAPIRAPGARDTVNLPAVGPEHFGIACEGMAVLAARHIDHQQRMPRSCRDITGAAHAGAEPAPPRHARSWRSDSPHPVLPPFNVPAGTTRISIQ